MLSGVSTYIAGVKVDDCSDVGGAYRDCTGPSDAHCASCNLLHCTPLPQVNITRLLIHRRSQDFVWKCTFF